MARMALGFDLFVGRFLIRCGLHPLADGEQGVKILQADVHSLADVLFQMAGKVTRSYVQQMAFFLVKDEVFFLLRRFTKGNSRTPPSFLRR